MNEDKSNTNTAVENTPAKNLLTTRAMWTPEQIKLIQDTVAKGTTPDEFKLFLYTAQKYNFDPLIRQIWCVKYGTAPAAIFAGRDGFLHKAHESGQFNGMKTEPEFDDNKKIISATCKVYRKDAEHPIEVTVYIQEYNTAKSNWAKMPITMLCKVAESQALRKAFDISGIYSEEESAVIERSATIDANHVEVLDEGIQKEISDCKTEEQLKVLWLEYPQLQKKTYFIRAINFRKAEIKKQPELTDAQPFVQQDVISEEEVHYTETVDELPTQIEFEILSTQTLVELGKVEENYPDMKSNKLFCDLVTKQKMQIVKKKNGGGK